MFILAAICRECRYLNLNVFELVLEIWCKFSLGKEGLTNVLNVLKGSRLENSRVYADQANQSGSLKSQKKKQH